MPKLCFVDLETTGLDYNRHGIIQLAGRISACGETHSFNWSVAPFTTDSVDPKALEFLKLNDEVIWGFDKPHDIYKLFTEHLSMFVDKYNRTDKYAFIGYNSTFDWRFLYEWFKKNGDNFFGSYFFWPAIDVSVLAHQYLLKERSCLKNFKQSTVAEYLGIELDKTRLHDALYDIELCEKIYNKLQGECKMTDHDQTILDVDLDDTFEPKQLPDGEEVKLRVNRAEIHTSKNGNISLHVVFEDPTDETVDDIHTYFGLPDQSDGAKIANKKKLRLKQFGEAFGTNLSGADVERDLPGLEGECIVGLEEDQEYGPRNYVKSMNVPK